jgi:hypothetical protein
MDNCQLMIKGEQITATSPEGAEASLPLKDLFARVAPPSMDTGGVVLPDGIKMVFSEGPLTIWVGETPPRIYNFRWIAPDSPAPFGTGTEYRNVRLALPYLVLYAVFGRVGGGVLRLSSCNECFFRTEPLKSPEDPLCYPALLNCSRFQPQDGRPLSWICSQHLKHAGDMQNPDLNRRLAASYKALRHCLLETGFNYSSEHHEFSSWYSESRKIDPRINTVEAWQEASDKDPLFVLEVPWLPTGHSVGQVAQRILANAHVPAAPYTTASALARLVFNRKGP